MNFVTFVITEHEGLVAPDRPAERDAELVHFEGWDRPVFPVKEILGVERVVSQELIDVAMQLIRSAADHHVNRAPWILAEFRLLVAGLHLELLNRVDRRIKNDAAHRAFGVIDAVHRIVIAAGPLSIHFHTGLAGRLHNREPVLDMIPE